MEGGNAELGDRRNVIPWGKLASFSPRASTLVSSRALESSFSSIASRTALFDSAFVFLISSSLLLLPLN